jgi:[ribosomal protein S5]-alanine N-acetyltransferase
VTLRTDRLDLIPATPETTRAAIADVPALGRALGAAVPPSWPPELLDRPALEFTLDKLRRGPPHTAWWLYFVVLRADSDARVLIGSVGYKGPPTDDGTVEVGYGILPEYQRRGYASEAVRALVARAFAVPAVHRVIAETLPELTPSIGVMTKCGFTLLGEGSEPGVIRYELVRARFLKPAARGLDSAC